MDQVPANSWVTIFKRDTISRYLTAAKTAGDGNDITLSPTSTTMGNALEGKMVLVGGTSSKEFVSDAGPDATATYDVDNGATQATKDIPFVATNLYAHHSGDSAVQYTCGWPGATTQDPWTTMGGIDNRDNKCAYTTLLGLPVIPVESSAGIKPGDYLRIDFPVTSDHVVDEGEEELYRVNAVMDNDLVVTHKPLSVATGAATNVNRYPGGTSLDLLSFKKTVSYSTGTVGTANHATNAITATLATSVGINVGDYCLIDNEFMYIKSKDNTVVTFDAMVNPAGTNIATWNQGRAAFGTAGVAHAVSGDCHVFTYETGAGGQGFGMPGNYGKTTIYDPRVSIRQLTSVDSSTQMTLGGKGDAMFKTGSEPANVIGDPYEVSKSTNPTRSGRDYGCATVGRQVVTVAGTIKVLVSGAHSQTATTITLDDTAHIAIGDYLYIASKANWLAQGTAEIVYVTAVPSATTITVVRNQSPTPHCLPSTAGTIADDSYVMYVHYMCPVIGPKLSLDLQLAADLTNDATATAITTAGDITADPTLNDVSPGDVLKLGAEYMLVKAVTGNNAMIVERNVALPCGHRTSTLTAHATGSNAWFKVIVPKSMHQNCPTLGWDLLADGDSAASVIVTALDDTGLADGTDHALDVTDGGSLYVAAGDFVRVQADNGDFEYMQVAEAEIGGDHDAITVFRQTSPDPVCLASKRISATTNAAADAAANAGDVNVVSMNIPSTDGEDYQIDANRLKAGSAYLVGALGDMLEDVNRDSTMDPNVDVVGRLATSFFASPWGKGGNVTEFCYAASSRSTTTTTAMTADGTTVTVSSLDALGVISGDFVQVTTAAGDVIPGTGEYMMVTSINAGTSTLTVIRGVAPNCLEFASFTGAGAREAWAAGAKVTLVTADTSVVQLVDSVTKAGPGCPVVGGDLVKDDGTTAVATAADPGDTLSVQELTLVADGNKNVAVGDYLKVGNEFVKVISVDGGFAKIGVIRNLSPDPSGKCPNLASMLGIGNAAAVKVVHMNQKSSASGSCAVVAAAKGADVKADVTSVTATTITYDNLAPNEANNVQYPFKVGGFIKIRNEYMLVTGIAKTAGTANDGTLTVVRDVDVPCLDGGPQELTDNDYFKDGDGIFEVATGGCYVMPAAGAGQPDLDTDLTTSATTVHLDDASAVQVGGYLFANNEYMLVTDIDVHANGGSQRAVTVVRNVAPPCVMGTTVVTSTLNTGTVTTGDDGAKILALSLSGSDNMISTSMRAIVELSPREPIMWAAAAPAPPPSPHYVDLKVGIEYSLAEFNVPSVTEPFKRAIARVAGTTADKIVLS